MADLRDPDDREPMPIGDYFKVRSTKMHHETYNDDNGAGDLLELIQRPAWQKKGACNGLDPNLFFPERGFYPTTETHHVCKGCPVREECLEYAVERPSLTGVWGGVSSRQRRNIRAQRRMDVA